LNAHALYGSDGSASGADVAEGTNEADSMMNATTGNMPRTPVPLMDLVG
jgi:hypothetical protein